MKNKFKPQIRNNKYMFKPNIGHNKLYPSFTFKNYRKSDYFTIEDSNEARHNLYNVFDGLTQLSNFTWEWIKNNPRIFHFHDIDIYVAELHKFNDSIDYSQFKVPNLAQGRFVGYFDENNVFNIVLYDANHKIYSRN